jgi:hypothetical protein
MGRGLSCQQCQILGLAVALARRRKRKGKLVAADPTGEPDITVAFAAVIVGGVALLPEGRPSGDFGRQIVIQDRSPAALSVRTSITRAFGSLVRRELLAPCGPTTRRSRGGRYGGRYRLTEAGVVAGLPYKMPITAEMRLVFWLLEP